MKRVLFFTLTVVLATGCSLRLGDFTLISSKNVDLTHGADFKRSSVRVKGEDLVPIVIGIPMGQPNMKTAIDHAIEKTPGAVGLVDSVLSQKVFNFIIFGQMGYEVEGTPLIDPKLEKTYQ